MMPGANAELLHLAVNGGPVKLEFTRNSSNVPVMALQRRAQLLRFLRHARYGRASQSNRDAGLLQMVGQVGEVDNALRGQGAGVLNAVGQFADVARPRMGTKRSPCRLAEEVSAIVALAAFAQQPFYQPVEIATFPKRWHRQHGTAEAEI